MSVSGGDRWRWRGTALAACLALAFGACGAQERDGAGTGTSAEQGTGEMAPDFSLPGLDGGVVTLSAYRGKTVVVDFWATWCPPCVFQMPELDKLWRAHRDRGDLMVIGVSVDTDGADAVRSWLQEQNPVEYTIALGSTELAEEFQAPGFPTLAVVSPDGSIYSRHVGLIEYEKLEELVAKAGGH